MLIENIITNRIALIKKFPKSSDVALGCERETDDHYT